MSYRFGDTIPIRISVAFDNLVDQPTRRNEQDQDYA